MFFILLMFLFTFVGLQSIFAQDFVLRTEAANLGSVANTNGVALADYDRDGDLDLYFVANASYKESDPKTWNRLFSNRGDGAFFDVTSTAGLVGRNSNATPNPTGMGSKMGASWGDYDNDGWPDLYLTYFGSNQLFHNNGDGTFTDVTAQAGVTTRQYQLSSSALWFDYDRDGDLDLYVSIYAEYFRQPADNSNRLYENIGNGQFQNVSQASGAADQGLTWTTVAIDANNDGYLDLYLANDFGPNKFYLNNGNKTFVERTAEYALEDRFHGMGLAVADCDGNGFFDIYLTNITEAGSAEEINPLFLNTGQNYFYNYSVDAGVALAGWGWGAEFFDLENDGDEDLVVVTNNFLREFPRVLFQNQTDAGAPRFSKITHEVGLADSIVSRSVAIFDYDNDGDSDLLVSNFFETVSLYENTLPHGNWLEVKLEGVISNRDALGAAVELHANGKTYHKYHHGAQFLAQNIQPVHFGLADAQVIDSITVRWPSGYVEKIGAVQINQTIKIKEQSGLISGVKQNPHVPPLPYALKLLGNYPNPFNGSTHIRFEIGIPGDVEIRITNLQGQVVKVMRESFADEGDKRMTWDGTDMASQPISSGLYFYSLTINKEIARDVGKMLYVK